MALYGYAGDVNNTIPMSNMYPGGRATSYVPPTASSIPFRNNSAGELSALNQDAYFNSLSAPVMAAGMNGRDGGRPVMKGSDSMTAGPSIGLGKPAGSWLMFLVIFLLFVWVSRKYGEAGSFSNIRMSVFNGLFLTFFIVLMLNLLKVFATKVKIPGVSELILAA